MATLTERLGQASGGDCRQRRPLNVHTGYPPGPMSRGQRGGLPGPGRSDDHRQASGVGKVLDESRLFRGRPRLADRGDDGEVHGRAGLAAQVVGEDQGSAFGAQQVGGGVPALAVLVTGRQRHRVVGRHDQVGEVLKVPGGRPAAPRAGSGRALGASRRGRGGGMSGDPGRAEQLDLQGGAVGWCGRPLPAEDIGDQPSGSCPAARVWSVHRSRGDSSRTWALAGRVVRQAAQRRDRSVRRGRARRRRVENNRSSDRGIQAISGRPRAGLVHPTRGAGSIGRAGRRGRSRTSVQRQCGNP